MDLDPGTRRAPTIQENGRIGLASTKPEVNVDQILASLDGDTQAYLRLLLAGGAEALGPDKGAKLLLGPAPDRADDHATSRRSTWSSPSAATTCAA